MDEKPLVSEKIKLHLVESEAGGAELSQSARTDGEQAPAQEVQPVTGDALQNCKIASSQTPERKAPRSKAELIRILGDPNSPEEDWVAASREIEAHGGYKTSGAASGGKRKKIIVSTALLTTALAALYWFTQSWLTPKPSPPPVSAPKSSQDVDFGPYMANLQRQIKRNWFPPKGTTSDRIQVLFRVSREGEVSNLHIMTPGLSEESSRAALDAVSRAAENFGQLPASAPEFVDIEFTFDYNVFNGGGRGTFRQF